jgi:cytochrome c-type biogenesis protein CcmF
MAALGLLGVVVSIVSAAVLTVRGLYGVFRPERAGAASLRWPAIGLLAGGVLAMVALEAALLSDDFTVAYVANNSATTTPFLYKIASAWAALEGSLVLWGLVLGGFTFLVWLGGARRTDPDPLWSGALGIMGLVTAFFYVLMATVSNPFEVCTATQGIGCGLESAWPFTSTVQPIEGLGPNPLLQNHPLMAAHPPTLYVGYVGLTVPFAFAISALLRGESGDGWLRRTRLWTRIAWLFLTAGIVLGGLWSYEVLGWGGYWAWDPVENASFMPWLVATAFLHSAAVQLRRGVLQAWNFILVIATFSLTILGTFLTRSGVIVSVHSFTQSPIGPALLWFLMFVLVGSIGLFAMRIHTVASAPRLDSLASREGMFLVNNLLLTLFAFIVLTGTLYPMVIEAITGDQVGVGRPFFDRMAIPLSFALILAMGIGPFTPYRSARPAVVWERIRNPLRVALAGTALMILFGHRNGWQILAVLTGSFVISLSGRQLWTSARRSAAKRNRSILPEMVRVMRSDRSYWGGQIAHVGVVLLAIGIAVSANNSVEGEFDMVPGDTIEFAGHDITFVGPFDRREPNRNVLGATVEIRRGGDVTTLEPRLNQYPTTTQSIASPAVRTGIRGDLYLSLAAIDPSRITLGIYWFPFIWLVWVGGFMAALGAAWGWLVRAPKRAVKEVVRE